MEILDSVACADTFPNQLGAGASLGPVYRSNGGYFAVTNNDVYVQLFYGPQGDVHFTPPFHVAPGNGVLVPGTVGVMFRNYSAGKTATVSAGLAEPTEPTVQLTAAGVAGGGGGTVTELAYAEITSVVNVPSGSNIVVVTAPSVTVDGATVIMVEFYSPKVTTPQVQGGSTTLILHDNSIGADIGFLADIQVNNTSSPPNVQIGASVFARRRITPSAGPHVFAVLATCSFATPPQVFAGGGAAGQYEPAFIRVTSV